MKSGNPVPDANSHDRDVSDDADRPDGQQVADIQELIARLESVTRSLANPLRTLPRQRDPEISGLS